MTDASSFSPDHIENARKLFAGEVKFLKGVVKLEGLPAGDRPEIAFAGRSNVGKSSLINAMVNRKQLARASNTPGRTQEINYFEIGSGKLYLVDLPGYGFAEAPKKSVEAWSRFTLTYLRGRATLKRVFLLIDARRGLGEVDVGVMDKLDAAAVSYQIVLTKADKIKPADVAATRAETLLKLKNHAAAHPHEMATSSEDGAGLPELTSEILSLI